MTASSFEKLKTLSVKGHKVVLEYVESLKEIHVRTLRQNTDVTEIHREQGFLNALDMITAALKASKDTG